MDESKLVGTPIITRWKLSGEDNIAKMNEIEYRSMIWKLKYVIHCRLDIALEVAIVATFSKNPKENHMMSIERISI